MTTTLLQPPPSPLLASAVEAGFRPLQRFSWYKRAQAWALARGNPNYEARVHAFKSRLFSSLEGNVVEIGPGGGLNLGFFAPDVRWTGVEPNPFFHPHIQNAAVRLGREVEVRLGAAEHLPFSDKHADAVVCSLVLCSVRDLDQTLREVRRVLRPGGRFVFIEHVGAPAGTPLRWVQRLVRPLWLALADGCHPDRDTALALRKAGFDDVDIEPFDVPIPIIGPHIAGVAWNS